MALLKFQDETGAEQYVHVGSDRPEVIIGRVRTCDLVTTNITVSRRHASVKFEGGAFVIRDLNSANGIFHDKQRVAELELKDGDSLLIGSLHVFFELEPADMKGAAVAKDTPVSDALVPEPGRPAHAAPTVNVPQQVAPVPGPKPAPPKPAPVPAAPPPKPVAPPVPAPKPVEPKTEVDERPRNVPAAFRADWKPRAQPAASVPVLEGVRIPEPRPVVPPASGKDMAARAVELEKALDLERADREQIMAALNVAQERYYEVSERADAAEAALVDVRSEIDLVARENREMADRADELELLNADLMQQVDDLRRELGENSSASGGFEQRLSSLAAENDRLRSEISSREVELGTVRDELEALRAAPVNASSSELEAALRQIEDLKLSNKGYLKRISRLMEEQEKAVPVGAVVTPEIVGAADRLVELVSDAIDAAGVARSLVSELGHAVVSPETISEMRNAVGAVSESLTDLAASAREMQSMLKPPV